MKLVLLQNNQKATPDRGEDHVCDNALAAPIYLEGR
jgi:hypothetical protein